MDHAPKANPKTVVAPTRRYCVLFAATLLAICALIAHFHGGYFNAVARNGDNEAYSAITSFIVHPASRPVSLPKQFWGLPYFAALLTFAGMQPIQAIALISSFSVIGVAWLASELWSGWVAMYTVAMNYTLIQFGIFGGSDALFAFLLLLGLYIVRRKKWVLGIFVFGIASVVRPLGVCFVVAVLMQLAFIRRFRVFFGAAAVVAAIFGVYSWSLARHVGDALANVHGYAAEDWRNRMPVTWPLTAIIGNLRSRANIASPLMLVVKCGYLLAHVSALVWILLRRTSRSEFFLRTTEGVGVLLYSVFIICYNAPSWALSIYPRVLMPVFPILLAEFVPRPIVLPRSLVWVLGLGSALLAAAANIGFTAVIRGLFQP